MSAALGVFDLAPARVVQRGARGGSADVEREGEGTFGFVWRNDGHKWVFSRGSLIRIRAHHTISAASVSVRNAFRNDPNRNNQEWGRLQSIRS